MLRRDRRVTTAGDVVNGLLSHLNLLTKVREQQAAIVWEEVVGRPIAAKTEVVSAQRGVLQVRAQTPAWAQELALQEGQIRRRLNEKLGGDIIREIRFSTRGPFRHSEQQQQQPAVPHPRPKELDAVVLGPQEKAAIGEAVAEIGTPDIADALERAVTRQMRLARWRLDHGWRPCGRCGELVFGDDLCVGCRIAAREEPQAREA